MDWSKTPEDFAWDGSLRDIYVLDTSLEDWSQLLLYIRDGDIPFHFSYDDEECPLPTSVNEIIRKRLEVTPLLTIDPGGLRLNCHFFHDAEIELDFDPRDFEAPEKVERLSEFLAGLGKRLEKPVLVTHENARYFDYARHLVIWWYEPRTDRWYAH
jgi:hypothetical protein